MGQPVCKSIDEIEHAINEGRHVHMHTDGRVEIGELGSQSLHDLEAEMGRARDEIKRLNGLINTPEVNDFLEGVRREAAHQVERWGRAHDRSKSAESWFWLVGYLAGKALRSAITGDTEKALHHCISSAAALKNWHAAIQADPTGSGKGDDADLKAKDA